MWMKIDDKLHDHRKARKAGKAAMGVWVLAGTWSMDQHTDGFIPDEILTRWGTQADAKRLVHAGLWYRDQDDDGQPGHRFHDWLDYQPDAHTLSLKTKAENQARRAASAKANHERWHTRRGIHDIHCSLCRDTGRETG